MPAKPNNASSDSKSEANNTEVNNNNDNNSDNSDSEGLVHNSNQAKKTHRGGVAGRKRWSYDQIQRLISLIDESLSLQGPDWGVIAKCFSHDDNPRDKKACKTKFRDLIRTAARTATDERTKQDIEILKLKSLIVFKRENLGRSENLSNSNNNAKNANNNTDQNASLSDIIEPDTSNDAIIAAIVQQGMDQQAFAPKGIPKSKSISTTTTTSSSSSGSNINKRKAPVETDSIIAQGATANKKYRDVADANTEMIIEALNSNHKAAMAQNAQLLKQQNSLLQAILAVTKQQAEKQCPCSNTNPPNLLSKQSSASQSFD
jgi:hypothetical protein